MLGHSINFKFGPTVSLIKELEHDTYADLVILTEQAIAQLAKKELLQLPHTRIASTEIGIAKRPGIRSPDISNVELFKKFLNEAPSLAYTSEGISGIYIANLIEKFQMTELLFAKTKKIKGGYAAELITKGTCDYALQNMSELMAVDEVEIVGPLPHEIQLVTIFSGAVTLSSRVPKIGINFLDTLKSPKAQIIFKGRGLEILSI